MLAEGFPGVVLWASTELSDGNNLERVLDSPGQTTEWMGGWFFNNDEPTTSKKKRTVDGTLVGV